MKNSVVFSTRVIGLLLLTTSVLFAQNTAVTPQVLHESLGEVIDPNENTRFNIFGDIVGLTVARLYRIDEEQYELHLLRNADGRAQILIVDLPAESYSRLRFGVLERIDMANSQRVRFDNALYPIEEPDWAEDSTNKKLVLRDGNQLLVTLKRAQNDTLVVQTAGGLQIDVPDIHIAKVIDVGNDLRGQQFTHTDPNNTKLFFGPTGRGLKAGTGYFADYYIFFPTVAFGITDFFSVAAGMSIFPAAESQLFYIAPKLAFQVTPSWSLAAGLLYLDVPNENDDQSLGYAVTTIGDDRTSVTLGAGLPLTSDSEDTPLLLVGAEAQISNRSKLITENWLSTGENTEVVFSGGIRFFGESIAVGLAFITVQELFDSGGFPFIPWVDFSVSFGK
jgi:hypothetical protein